MFESTKMGTLFDEKEQLWSNSYHELTLDKEFSVNILKLLSRHGSRVAQVNYRQISDKYI